MDATSLLVELYCQAYADGISVFSRYPVGELGAATIEMNGRYAVFIDDEQFGTAADELCALAHECGHVHTGATHAVASPYDLIERHEYRADRWAIHQLLPPERLQKAMGSGGECWQLAEELGLPQHFICKAIDLYRAEGRLQ